MTNFPAHLRRAIRDEWRYALRANLREREATLSVRPQVSGDGRSLACGGPFIRAGERKRRTTAGRGCAANSAEQSKNNGTPAPRSRRSVIFWRVYTVSIPQKAKDWKRRERPPLPIARKPESSAFFCRRETLPKGGNPYAAHGFKARCKQQKDVAARRYSNAGFHRFKTLGAHSSCLCANPWAAASCCASVIKAAARTRAGISRQP